MLPGRLSPQGALFMTSEAPAEGDPRSGGVCMNALGVVKANANAPQRFDQGKGFMNNGALCIDVVGTPIAGYVNGLPVTAAGALKAQLNVAFGLTDTFVGGIRVGTLGGIYVIDVAPPPEYAFSNGFSNGFDIS